MSASKSSLYNLQVQRALDTAMKDCPVKRLHVSIAGYQDYISLVVYRDNIESYSDPHKLLIAEWLYKTRDTIRDLGVRCFIEGREKP